MKGICLRQEYKAYVYERNMFMKGICLCKASVYERNMFMKGICLRYISSNREKFEDTLTSKYS